MSLLNLFPRRAAFTWGLLVLLAVANPLLSHETTAARGAIVAILVLACIKVRLVGLDFMELRHAPRQMRLAFEAYCAALALILIVAYLAA